MASQIQPRLFPGRAMGERHMIVGNVVEEMQFLFL